MFPDVLAWAKIFYNYAEVDVTRCNSCWSMKPACTGCFRFKIAANTQFITRASAALILTRAQSKRTRTTATVSARASEKGRGRGGVEKFPITYLSAAPNRKVHCWAEKVGMLTPPPLFFLFFSWRVFGRGSPLCERKDVLWNSNKFARSFVGLELRRHCSSIGVD